MRSGPGHRGRRGRRGPSPLILGVDVGATKVRAGLVDSKGRCLGALVEELLEDRRPSRVIRSIADLSHRLEGREGSKIVATGVAIAAQVDSEGGRVRYAPNLAWTNVPLGRQLQRTLGVPVTLENDARAATWGEWRFGAGRGARALFGLVVGTGVGGAFVQDGHRVGGAIDAAGEVGHLSVVTGGRRCSCPNRGCLEAYSGGWAIAQQADERVRADPALGRWLLGQGGSTPTARTVLRGARARDPLSLDLLEGAADHLASGVVSIVNAFNPDRVVLGGGLLLHWPGILGRLRREVRARCQPPAASAVRIRFGSLGPAAPILGAADLAFARL